MNEESILIKLDYISQQIGEIKDFIKNIDIYFDRRYEEKRKSCPGYLWGVEGIDKFEDLNKNFGLHIEKHKNTDEINNKVITNRKWIITLVFAQGVAIVIWLWKYLVHK